ncbi:MAG: hypothetical protein Q9226_004374 [Calogaya cf. arnoldii]
MSITRLASNGVEAVQTGTGSRVCVLNSATEYFKLDAARPLTVIPENPATVSSSTATTTSAQPRTSSLSSASTPSTPTATAAPALPTPNAAEADSGGSSSTNKGLAAGLGITLGLALIGGLLFGLYKWDQRRRMKRQPHMLKRTSAAASPPDAVSLPTTMAERNPNAQMEWEMPTREEAHGAPSWAQTQQTPGIHSGF